MKAQRIDRQRVAAAPPKTAPHPAVDRHALICAAAYYRAARRDFAPGSELEDWLAAEAEVDQRLYGEGRTF